MDTPENNPEFPNPRYTFKGHVFEALNSLTQCLNAFAGSCDANQSTSERAYWRKGWLMKAIDFVFGEGHCYDAMQQENQKAVQRLQNQGYIVMKKSTFNKKVQAAASGDVEKVSEPEDSIVNLYMQNAYSWAQDQRVYNEVIKGQEDIFREGLSRVDYAYMFSEWTDEEIQKTWVSFKISNLALSAAQNKALVKAMNEEYWKRFKTKAPKGHGMNSEGAPK